MIDTSTYFMMGYLALWVILMGGLGLVLKKVLRIEKDLTSSDS